MAKRDRLRELERMIDVELAPLVHDPEIDGDDGIPYTVAIERAVKRLQAMDDTVRFWNDRIGKGA